MALEQWYQGRTLVFGHRGASAYAPMNTIPAFELAAQQGADGVELDVWLSKDDHLVIMHDATVDQTTNGTGHVYEQTLAQLKALDASHRFSDQYGPVTIPTLDEVFEAVGKRLIVNVEIKADAAMRPGTEQAVADCIARHGLEQSVIVSSFSAHVLANFRAVAPDVAVGFLFKRETPPTEWDIIRTVPHEAVHPHHELLDSTAIFSLKRDGYRINTWTVNDPERAVRLAILGVDAVITDYPDVILNAIRGGP